MTQTPDLRDAARRAAELIASADSLIITAGAGMGVDSGLPDFRGSAGLWRAYPALGRANLRFEEIASPAAFARDPELAWGFYGHRLALYRRTVPHVGFGLLRQWAERMPRGGFVFTSNVDGQFQIAGFDTERIHECHGSLHGLQCIRPCSYGVWSAMNLVPDIDEAACRWRGPLPTCPGCGSLARPNVLMFDDWLWVEKRYTMQRERMSTWMDSVERPVVIESGAGTHIPSVRNFGEWASRSKAGTLIRINPRESRVPGPRDLSFPTGSFEALGAIASALEITEARGDPRR